MITWHFSPHSSGFIELRSILEPPASRYFTELQTAWSYLGILIDKKCENIWLEELMWINNASLGPVKNWTFDSPGGVRG